MKKHVRTSSPLVCEPTANRTWFPWRRQTKIEHYHNKNQLESRLSDIQRAVDSGRADEEVVRDFYLLSFKRWIAVCLGEMESIAKELDLLRIMDCACESYAKPLAHPARPRVETFTLTRDALQAQVFGSGYPSLPTMTVGDWYQQRSQEERSHDLSPKMKPPGEMGSDLQRNQN